MPVIFAVIVPLIHIIAFSIQDNKLISYADDSTLLSVVSSPGARVTLAESQNCDLDKVSEWCDLWKMKLSASKTKTMMVTRSRTMHPQSPPVTIGGTGLKKFDDVDILGVTFDSKMTFRSIIALFPEQLHKGLVC